MIWTEVLKVGAAVIISLGGASGIIVVIAKGLASRIADRMLEKFKIENQYKFDRLLEEYRSDLEHKKHITQTSFDTEFEAYQELLKKFTAMIDVVYLLFFPGLLIGGAFESDDDLKNDCNEKLKAASSAYREANSELVIRSVFIPKDFFEQFQNVLNMSNTQICDYYSYNPWVMKNVHDVDQNKERRNCYKRSEELQKKWNELLDGLREYLRNQANSKE